MEISTQEILPIVGAPFAGGFFAGRINIDGQQYALIVAPKAEGEHKPAVWATRSKDVPGARSYCDGLANTRAMADAGSKLAEWATSLTIGEHDDWYLPSQDELELIYRHLKPTATETYCWSRSGINLSAIPPTYPYTPETPAQTPVETFRAGGVEAFESTWYWSSTQHASAPDYAWMQHFDYGTQGSSSKGSKTRARAVRRLKI